MPAYLLRLEAVNFDGSCYDTNDISTIRGGSMMLMNAHKLVARPPELSDPVAHGASHAVWKFEAPDDTAAEQVRTKLMQALADHERLRHATFVADVIPHVVGGADEMQRLRMLNRWRQLQQPTVTAPDLPETPDAKHPYCELDSVRPSVATIWKGKDPYRVSASVRDRRKYGKEQKQSFHADLTGTQLPVVNELGELTAYPDKNHVLNGKMAVIYIDGNQQSEMAAELDLAQLAEFREYMRERHGEFLKSLLDTIAANRPEARTSSEWFHWDGGEREQQVRLETLLWGGDDILLVVPAWQGWFVVQKFFECARDWQFLGEKFTHAVGVVFCNHKASIHDMRKLAERLFVQGKKQSGVGAHHNLIGYEVLESFDVTGADFDRWRAGRLSKLPGTDAKERLLLTPEQLQPVADLVRKVRQVVTMPDAPISRRQIEMRVRELQRHETADAAFNKQITDMKLGDVPDLDARQTLYHLATLWDYVP